MSAQPTKIPGIPKPPASLDPEVRKYLEALTEAVEIRLGRKGDPQDRAVTLRELIDSGLADQLRATPFDPNNPNIGNRGFTNPTETIRTSVIPQPTSFSVNAAYSTINLSWDFPNYKYHNQTEIWSHSSDVLGNATLAGVSTGRVYVDPVGGGVTRYYWIRHINTAGEFGPWNNTSGTIGTTPTDVAFMLTLLTSQITSSQLATALATPIGNLPANTTQALTAVETEVNGLEAQYTVKIDSNGHVAGFGLATTLLNGTPTSAFIVRADKFAIIDPANTGNNLTNTPSADIVPFVIDSGNTYIKMAMIKDAAITSAKIGSLDAGVISAGTISADRIGANSINASKLHLNNSTITSVDDANGVPTLTLGQTSITAAYIADAAIDTLQIAGFAVTVPAGDSATGLNHNVTGSLIDISGYTVLQSWDADGVPEALIIAGQAGFLGGNIYGTTSDFATGVVKFIVEFLNNQGTYTEITSSSIATLAYQSFRAGFGGQVTSTNHVAVPSWSRGARIKMQARNDVYPSNNSYSSARKVDKYGFFVLGSKK